MNWEDVLKVRPRKRKRFPDPPNVFAGEHTKNDKKRVMGRGLMRDKTTGELVESTRRKTPRVQRHKHILQRSKQFVPERGTRLGSNKAEEGEVQFGNKHGRVFKPKATRTFPKNRCARCGRMLSPRHRKDIDVKGKKLNLSFCDQCAEDMVRE